MLNKLPDLYQYQREGASGRHSGLIKLLLRSKRLKSRTIYKFHSTTIKIKTDLWFINWMSFAATPISTSTAAVAPTTRNKCKWERMEKTTPKEAEIRTKSKKILQTLIIQSIRMYLSLAPVLWAIFNSITGNIMIKYCWSLRFYNHTLVV